MWNLCKFNCWLITEVISLGIPYFNSQTSPKNYMKFGKDILQLDVKNPPSF